MSLNPFIVINTLEKTLSTGNNRISKAIEGVHEGGIFSVCVMKDGTLLSGGGKDRKIVQFDSSYTKTGVETEVIMNVWWIEPLLPHPSH